MYKRQGKGYWPSFWFLPDQSNCTKYPRACDAWPTSGEYDLVEIPGDNPREIHMTEHDAQTAGPGDGTVTYDVDASDGWHTYGFDREPGFLKWYIDGKLYKTFTNSVGLKDYPFYPIANFSLGGPTSWGGAGGPIKGGIDSTTVYPAEFTIDYMRVWQPK